MDAGLKWKKNDDNIMAIHSKEIRYKDIRLNLKLKGLFVKYP